VDARERPATVKQAQRATKCTAAFVARRTVAVASLLEELEQQLLTAADRSNDNDNEVPFIPFAGLTRVLNQEERRTPEAQQARLEEIRKVAAKNTIGMPVSEQDALRSDPNATVSGTWNLSSIKHVEKGVAGQKHKGRLVLLGDKIIRLADAARVFPKGEDYGVFGSVATLEAMRLVLAHGLSGGQDGRPFSVEAADLSNAYLNAPWEASSAPLHFLRLRDEDIRGLSADSQQRVRELRAQGHAIVFPMLKCLYGHPLSGHVWVEMLYRHLRDHGWTAVQGVTGLFEKDGARLCAYVDDILISGPADVIHQFWIELEATFEVGKLGPAEEFLGAQLEFSRKGEFHETRVHLEAYIEVLEKRFNERWNTTVRSAGTPLSDDLRNPPVDVTTPQSRVLELVGMLLWVARVSRPDVAYAASRLASRVSRWTTACDEQLARTVGYLKATKHVRLTMRRHQDDRPEDLRAELHSDASWVCEKSQSGYVLTIVSDRGSLMPVAWGSSKQAIQADSSAASELIAVHTAIRECLPVAQAYRSDVLPVHVDNAAVLRVAKKGSSAQLGLYTTKPLRIRAGLLRDLVELGVITVQYVPSLLNRSDACTKPLERVKLEYAREMFGLV